MKPLCTNQMFTEVAKSFQTRRSWPAYNSSLVYLNEKLLLPFDTMCSCKDMTLINKGTSTKISCFVWITAHSHQGSLKSCFKDIKVCTYSDLPNNCATNLILILGKKHLHNLIRTYLFINFWDFSFKTWFSPI